MRIAVDANGADLGPAEVAAGAAIAAGRGVTPVLFGSAAEIGAGRRRRRGRRRPDLDRQGRRARSARCASTPDASIVQAARAVAVGRLRRAAWPAAPRAPRSRPGCSTSSGRGASTARRSRPAARCPAHPVTLVDVGANVECRPEHLVQFAHMGAALATVVLGVERPRVGLLSNGEEATKGTPLLREAHAAAGGVAPAWTSSATSRATTSSTARADVVVTDGFTGNVALKLIEGVSQMMVGAIRERALSSPRAKAGGLLLRPALRALPRRDRPRGPRRRLPARPAPARRRPARALHPLRHLAGDPAGRPRGRAATSSGAPTRRSRRPGRCESAASRYGADRHDARRGLHPGPDPPRRRARPRSRRGSTSPRASRRTSRPTRSTSTRSSRSSRTPTASRCPTRTPRGS